jgi:hypothetical protein
MWLRFKFLSWGHDLQACTAMDWDCLIAGLLLLGLFDCGVILVHSNGLGLLIVGLLLVLLDGWVILVHSNGLGLFDCWVILVHSNGLGLFNCCVIIGTV